MEFILRVEDERSVLALLDLLDRFLLHQRFGALRAYAVWRIPMHTGSEVESVQSYRMGRNVFAHGSVPSRYWADFWDGLRKHGPSVMAHYARTHQSLFTWEEARRAMKPMGEEKWVYEVTKKYGMADGIYVPVDPWVVGMWSKNMILLTPHQRALLSIACLTVGHHLEDTLPGRNKRGRNGQALTDKEKTALRNLALGEEVIDIARIMGGIKEGTVKTFLRRAMTKLNAKNRNHAVLLATRERIVQ